MLKNFSLLIVIELFLLINSLNALQYNALAPDFTQDDIYDVKYQLSDFRKAIIVLEWRNPNCAYSQKHYDSKSLQTLQKEYTEKGVIWFTIITETPGSIYHMTQEDAKKLIKKEGWQGSYFILDEKGEIRKLYQVNKVPMIFVIGPHRRIQYMGAIDNIKSTNPYDIKFAKNYIKQALDTLLEYKYDLEEFPFYFKEIKSPPITESIPYGCPINF